MKEKTISIENSHQNVHNEWPIESTRSIVMHNLGLELDFEGFVTQESIPSTNELLDFINNNKIKKQSQSESSDDQSVGSQSKYTKQELLGKGGMGKVWRVFDQQLRRNMALKTLHETLQKNLEERENFLIEVQISAQLQHPGIVPIYEFFENEGTISFSMREVRGQTLDKVIKGFNYQTRINVWENSEQNWNIRKLISTMKQVCETMHYAHTRGVVHRDLKPQNIMVGEFGEVLIVDWGIAKVDSWSDDETIPNEDKVQVPISSKQLEARTSSISGTPLYMAPEQINSPYLSQDGRCDIFAIGIILFEIITGYKAFSSNYKQIFTTKLSITDCVYTFCIQSILEQNPTLEQRLDTAPKGLIKIVKKCLVPNREARFQSIAQLSKALQDWLDGADKRQKAIDCLKQLKDVSERRMELFINAKKSREEAIEVLEQNGRAEECIKHMESAHQFIKKVRDFDFSTKQTLSIGLLNAPMMSELHDRMVEIEHKEYMRLVLDGEQTQAEFLQRKIQLNLSCLPEKRAQRWQNRFEKAVSFTKMVRKTHGRHVGCVEEKIKLYSLYTHERLVSIVGKAGTGKTHIMLQTLFDRIIDSGDEILYCNVANTFNRDCVAQQFLSSLNMASVEEDVWSHITATLSEIGQVYIAFDNADCNIHTLLEIIPLILSQTTNVTIICSSRVPLNLPQEAILKLEAMQVVDAMMLFLQHACKIDPDFELLQGDHQRLVDIGNMLSSNPMALICVARKLERFSFQRIHHIVCKQKYPDKADALRKALSLTWVSLPTMAKTTMIQLCWLWRSFSMPLVIHSIDTSDFTEYTTSVEALKILVEEKWVEKTTFCSGKFYQVNSSIIDFVEQESKSYSNLSQTKRTFFTNLGEYFVQQIQETTEEKIISFIETNLENMILAVTESPLESAQIICQALLPFFEKYGPKSRGESIVKSLEERIKSEKTT